MSGMREGITGRALATGALAATLAACSDRAPRPDARARAYLADTGVVTQAERRRALSPDGRYVMVQDSMDYATIAITVTRRATGRAVHVVRIGEADPGSGASHRVAWSRDGAVLLIWGYGTLARREPVRLCLAYRMADEALWSDPGCEAGTDAAVPAEAPRPVGGSPRSPDTRAATDHATPGESPHDRSR